MVYKFKVLINLILVGVAVQRAVSTLKKEKSPHATLARNLTRAARNPAF